ncbi:hypothetical protein QZR14_12300 [Pseudomonas sp. rhizo66]|nr:hypothetical protein [Pseudomonas sp. rhizo66]MDT3312134.1 hypothetical protein [Pseudomonas sp. rhizo66]
MNSSSQSFSFAEAEHHRLTLEALADVKAGRVIQHQSVLAWVDYLIYLSSLPEFSR